MKQPRESTPRFCFDVRTLFIGVTLLSLCLAVLSYRLQQAYAQRRAVEVLEQMSHNASFIIVRYDDHELGSFESRALLDHLFHHVVEVHIYSLDRDVELGDARMGFDTDQEVNAAFALIGRLSKLKQLHLGDANGNDDGVKHLRELRELEELTLNDFKLSDEGLACLQGMKQLRELTLIGTEITDRGLPYLEHLTNLTRLFLGSSYLTAEAVERLREKLPNTEIHCSGGECAGAEPIQILYQEEGQELPWPIIPEE